MQTLALHVTAVAFVSPNKILIDLTLSTAAARENQSAQRARRRRSQHSPSFLLLRYRGSTGCSFTLLESSESFSPAPNQVDSDALHAARYRPSRDARAFQFKTGSRVVPHLSSFRLDSFAIQSVLALRWKSAESLLLGALSGRPKLFLSTGGEQRTV